jgi:hypothetical protein
MTLNRCPSNQFPLDDLVELVRSQREAKLAM